MPAPACALRVLTVAAALLWPPASMAGTDEHKSRAHHDMIMASEPSTPHLMGHGEQKFYMYPGTPAADAGYDRIESAYDVPHVMLVNEDGAAVDLARLLRRPGPVALQFIFTSCATICPVLSAGFSQAQDAMLARDPSTRLISISIDPEYDTPARLKTYAARYHARRNWIFLTGTLGDIRTVIKAFDALYQTDSKMYHRPYTYFRAQPGNAWVRLEGLLSEADLVREFEAALASDAKDTHRASAGSK